MIDKNNSEIKQQLYGGEISDYYRNVKLAPADDNKELGSIYDQIARKNKLSRFKLNTGNNLNNKL